MTIVPVYVQGLTEVIGPPKITVTPSIYFFQPLSLPPVKRTQPNISPFWSGIAEQPKITITPSTYWFQPLPTAPVRTKENLSPRVFFGRPPLITVTPTSFGWYQPLADPPVETKPNASPTVFFGQPPKVTVTPSKFDFYQPLSVPPVATKSNLSPASFLGLLPPPAVTPSTWDWYQPLSGVPAPGTKSNFGLSATFVATLPSTPTPSDLSFYQPLSTSPFRIAPILQPAAWLVYNPDIVPPPEVPTVGGHFLPLTKKELEELHRREKVAREAQEAGWDQAAKDKAELHEQIMATMHPEKVLGVGKTSVVVAIEDDDEEDIETIMLYE